MANPEERKQEPQSRLSFLRPLVETLKRHKDYIIAGALIIGVDTALLLYPDNEIRDYFPRVLAVESLALILAVPLTKLTKQQLRRRNNRRSLDK